MKLGRFLSNPLTLTCCSSLWRISCVLHYECSICVSLITTVTQEDVERERDMWQCSTKNHITQQISWFWLRAGVSVCKNWLFWLLKALHDTDYMLFLLTTWVKWLLSTSGETRKTFCITFNLHYLKTSHFLLYFTMCSVRIYNFSNSFRIAISFT